MRGPEYALALAVLPARDTGNRRARQEPGFTGRAPDIAPGMVFPAIPVPAAARNRIQDLLGHVSGLPWRTRETAFSSFLCRKTGGPLPRRPWHYRKSKARDREAVLPDTSNWRIIVPDTTSSASKTHAKLNGTAFRAVWRPLPVASCMCAQAAGLHARRGSTAVSG